MSHNLFHDHNLYNQEEDDLASAKRNSQYNKGKDWNNFEKFVPGDGHRKETMYKGKY